MKKGWGRTGAQKQLTLENKAVLPLAKGPTSSTDLTPLRAFLTEMGFVDLGLNRAIRRKTRRTTSERRTRSQLNEAGAISVRTSAVGRSCDIVGLDRCCALREREINKSRDP